MMSSAVLNKPTGPQGLPKSGAITPAVFAVRPLGNPSTGAATQRVDPISFLSYCCYILVLVLGSKQIARPVALRDQTAV
jgi:hypothetical protein